MDAKAFVGVEACCYLAQETAPNAPRVTSCMQLTLP